jgi:hypothetical protein
MLSLLYCRGMQVFASTFVPRKGLYIVSRDGECTRASGTLALHASCNSSQSEPSFLHRVETQETVSQQRQPSRFQTRLISFPLWTQSASAPLLAWEIQCPRDASDPRQYRDSLSAAAAAVFRLNLCLLSSLTVTGTARCYSDREHYRHDWGRPRNQVRREPHGEE